MFRTVFLAAGLALGLGAATAVAGETPAPEGATVYIISPEDGASVSNPVTVVFGLEGMGVAPAGVEKENTGHHHLLIDVDPSTIDPDSPLPADDNHRHFGGGQTQTSVELAPGEHTLILMLGDQNHIPHDPPVLSEPVTITVQ
jgi:Domain of unknown function (DUF4399)